VITFVFSCRIVSALGLSLSYYYYYYYCCRCCCCCYCYYLPSRRPTSCLLCSRPLFPLLLSLILSFSFILLFFLSCFFSSSLLRRPVIGCSQPCAILSQLAANFSFFLSNILMESRVASHRTVHPCHTEKEKGNMRNVSARLFITTASLRVDKFRLCRLNLKRTDGRTDGRRNELVLKEGLRQHQQQQYAAAQVTTAATTRQQMKSAAAAASVSFPLRVVRPSLCASLRGNGRKWAS